MVDQIKKKPEGLSLTVGLSNGEEREYSLGEANALGFTPQNVTPDAPQKYYYKDKFGNEQYTDEIADLPISISLNEETGNIRISAPKSVYESEMFKQVFNEDELKKYSLAYKSNPNYKVSVQEKNKETGEMEDREITIPEYIERLNSAAEEYRKELLKNHQYRKDLVKEYGDNAKKLSDEQIHMAMSFDGKSIYLPNSIFRVGSFGNGKGNVFTKLRDKRDADGRISVEDLMSVYNMDNFGRDEMAALLAHINGTLSGSFGSEKWVSDAMVEDEEGNLEDNPSSAEEVAKLLNFKNYILTNNPHSEWYQQAGASIESATYNFAYGALRVFANMANMGEAIITGNTSKAVDNFIRETDDAMEYFNTYNTEIWDGIANAQIIGFLTGTVYGSALAGKVTGAVTGKVAGGVSKLAQGLTNKIGGTAASALGMTESSIEATASSLNTIKTTVANLRKLAMHSDEVATGTKIMLASLTMAQKATLATNMAISAISRVKEANVLTEFLFDTIHDAMLYDSTTLREVMSALSKDPNDPNKVAALRYWGEQLLDNAKYWAPISMFRATKNIAGKTTLGKAMNIRLTKTISKLRAAVGSKMKRDWANGALVSKLKEQLNAAQNSGATKKADRIAQKLDTLANKRMLNIALKDLGDLKLDWDGIKLTEASADAYKKALNRIKGYEVAIDARLRSVDTQVNQMVGLVKDPSTGKVTYINPTLGGASAVSSQAYYKLANIARKYGLPASSDTLWSQDMVNYFMGSNHAKIMGAISEAGGEHAKEAKEALEQIQKNVAVAKSRLPDEISEKLDELLNSKLYQNYYAAQNEYGIAHGLLEKSKFESYANNPIWQENGYMPTIVKHDLKGKWVDEEGRLSKIIEQEMNEFTYKVGIDQDYVDPELTKLTRQRTMAAAQVNKDFWDTYNAPGSSATNITKITGEETEYARALTENTKNLKDVIAKQVAKNFSEGTYTLTRLAKDAPAFKRETVSEETLDEITASLSPSETAEYLVNKGVLPKRGAKLTDTVTQENYNEWYGKQSEPVKKFLQGKYAEQGKTGNVPMSAREIEENLEDENLILAILSSDSTQNSELENAIAKTAGSEAPANTIKASNDLESQIQINASKERIKELEKAKTQNANDYEYFQKAKEVGGVDFESGLERAYLAGDKSFAKSDLANEAAKNIADGKDAFYQGTVVAELKGRLRGKVKNLDVDVFVDTMMDSIRKQVDAMVSGVMKTTGVKDVAKAIAKDSNGSEDVAKYLIYQELAKPENLKSAADGMRGDLHKEILKKNLTARDEETIFKEMKEVLNDTIETEFGNAVSVVKTINPDLVDNKAIYDKVKSLNDKITAAEKKAADKDSDWVIYLDDQGRKAFAQVDPAFASLYKFYYKTSQGDAMLLSKINAMFSKAFRYGTTSVNLASFGNQLFRDFGNAMLVGGAWDTIKANADNLVDVFGQSIVNQLKMFDPEGYEEKQLKLYAENLGLDSGKAADLEKAAVSRELSRGAAIASSTTEASLYMNLRKKLKASDGQAKLKGMQSKLQDFVDKHSVENLLNGKRENYLRKRVYASNLNDAMEQGYTLQQARLFAEFAMNNATTNFARQLYHMQAIADSTPYFSAAINGTKSFWRMWALDPVGVTGRVMGGLILPTMALTGASLMDEENRKIYKNIPEYNKENSFVFVFNGQVVSMPIPQELSAIVAPFRQFVEYVHEANENDFGELMFNDLLGFSPVDLKGFSTIDMNKMVSDPTIFDRISRGSSRIFSQVAPVPVKTAYMLATGIDPYTGKNLRDRDYMYWNDETDSVETMSYNQNAFAKLIADLWGDDMSADLAEKIVSGIIGTTGSNLLDDITTLFTEGAGKAALSLGENTAEQLTKPITVDVYDRADSDWKSAVRQLTAEKEAILNSKEMKTLNDKLSQTKDPDERKKLLATRQNLVDAFQQKVGDTVKRLEQVYGGTFDRQKLGATIQLLNFNSNSSYQTGSQYSSDLASGQFWEGRDAAIHTMEQLGVIGTSDMSIFGYLTTDKDGKPVVKYTSPIAIMDMNNQWTNQKDYHLANIKAIASQNDLWNRHEAIEDQINAIYAKDKLSNSDYDQIDAIYVNWNAEVMAALAPYVETMTPEAAINNANVIDYLDSLIEVPGDYKKDRYGKWVTNSKLGNGSANAAYIKNYIKNIFKVNDTGYSSGKNFSDRKTYDKENKRWISK